MGKSMATGQWWHQAKSGIDLLVPFRWFMQLSQQVPKKRYLLATVMP